ncbi:MAG: protein translocase subunit SecF [Thermodesulfobacteriota bacterium]
MELLRVGTQIDFISRMKPAAVLSIILIIISAGSVIYHGGLNMGVEFEGGTEVHIKFAQAIKSDEIRSIMNSTAAPVESVQQLGLPQDNEFLLRFSQDSQEPSDFTEMSFQKELEGLIKSNPKFKGALLQDIVRIGPNVTKELIRKAVISILLGWFVIMFYLMLRFEFGFGLGAVIAIIHDVIITVGALSVVDKEFTLTIVAALLTVIGYSVNDTIVIFDRIRENLRLKKNMGFRELVNNSVNQTLSRTILTVFTALLVLMSLFFFGGSVIHDFAYTLIVGITVGTYSSIFIASAFILVWRERKEPAAG